MLKCKICYKIVSPTKVCKSCGADDHLVKKQTKTGVVMKNNLFCKKHKFDLTKESKPCPHVDEKIEFCVQCKECVEVSPNSDHICMECGSSQCICNS